MSNTEYPAAGEITGLIDYLALIKTIQADREAEWEGRPLDGLWFRGQDDDRPLLPKVLRTVKDPDTGGDTCYNELAIVNTFTSLYRNYIAERFEEKSVELLAFMQHNGVPTRFLDWTESALMGLYFAVAEASPNAQGAPVVWIMNPGKLNGFTIDWKDINGPFLSAIPLVQTRIKMIGFQGDQGMVRPEFWKKYPNMGDLRDERLIYPIAFFPTASRNLRLATQKGCFTVHGTKFVPIETVFKDTSNERFLRKVTIKAGAAGQIREELRIAGITPRSVFPDLNGLSQELNGREHMLRSRR